MTDIRSGDIEKDDTREMKISPPSGGMKIALKKLKTGTVKDVQFAASRQLFHSRSSAELDQLIREYLLRAMDVA